MAALPPTLSSLCIADPPEAWSALGFTVLDDAVHIGGVRLQLGASGGRGIVGWSLRDVREGADLDGLVTEAGSGPELPAVDHPVGAIGVDHVVAMTPSVDRTVEKLRAAGFDYRRTREAGGGYRQAFFVVGPCLLELGGPAEGDVRFWGLTLVVRDLDATAAFLGDRLGRVKDAVQPGRRIATLKREAGLLVPLALMTPR